MDDDARRVARIKELQTVLAASDERSLVVEFMAAAQTYRVFLGNERELREYLEHHSDPAVAIPLWDVNNRSAFNAFLDEVTRLLHNYLAAVGSLRDHTRRLWKAHLPADEYNEQVRVSFAESPICTFVQDLRDYALHRQLPFAQGRMTFSQGEQTWAVAIRREELLKSSRWRAQAKDYLANLDDDWIDLLEVVAAYTDTVTHFNDWFGETFVERRADDFMRVREMEADIAEAFADLYRSRQITASS